jgi:hypothetical protein
MSLAFLHPEFFFWMVPPVLMLFYFWQTQKPLQSHWLGEKVLEKLRAPETTMGLKARNRLFLIAALALIGAMAQPVAIDKETSFTSAAEVVLLIETGNGDSESFGRMKTLGSELIGSLSGEEIAVLAFDTQVYRVAPMSNDGTLLAHLVRHLPRTARESDPSAAISKLYPTVKADALIVVARSFDRKVSVPFVLLNERSDIEPIAQAIKRLKEAKRLKHHVPLFFYPLGLAMLLIWIALSSMSARRSITVAALIGIMGMSETPVQADMFDFRTLHEANRAYEAGEYARSADLFGQYQRNHDSAQVRYNRANALYKARRYKQAEYWYKRVYTDDPVLEARRRFNLEQARLQIQIQHRRSGDDPSNSSDSETSKEEMKTDAKPLGGFKTRLYPY